MTFPAVATKVNLDAATDDPKLARDELADLVDKFNTLLGHFPGFAQTLVSRSTAALMRTDLAVAVATQAAQETGTSILTSDLVTPGRQHFNQSAAKGWVKGNISGGINASYNVTSIADTGLGRMTISWATDFSSTNYVVVATAHSAGARMAVIDDTIPPTAGTTEIDIYDSGGTLADPTNYAVAAFGDQ